MNNYYVIKHKRPKPNFEARIVGLLLNEKNEIIPSPFDTGSPVREKCSYMIKANGDSETGKFRDKLSVSISNGDELFVVSNKLQSLLEEYSSDVGFHALKIKIDGEINEEYKVANILKTINCANHEESDFIYLEMEHENIYNIDKLILNEKAIPPMVNIFLLGECVKPVIIVHERLKKAIEEAGLTGFVFVKPEDFQA